jgi:hypothetical protein
VSLGEHFVFFVVNDSFYHKGTPGITQRITKDYSIYH